MGTCIQSKMGHPPCTMRAGHWEKMCLTLCRSFVQISNVDDQSQDPIQRSKSVDCPAGGQQCSVSVPLTSDGGILEGVKYIVNVKALNRYGQSEVSGNSDVFSIGGDSRGKRVVCLYTDAVGVLYTRCVLWSVDI